MGNAAAEIVELMPLPITPPDVTFTQWEAVNCLKFSKHHSSLCWPGIYVWAWFPQSPSPILQLTAPPKEIIYIGEAKIPLWKRMGQFARSFAKPSSQHSGGGRCGKEFRDRQGELYASWFPLQPKKALPDFCKRDIHHWSRPFLHFVERTLIWHYVRQHGSKPFGNRT